MHQCPLCGTEYDESDLIRHYLTDDDLITFIQKKNSNWTKDEGACSSCLEGSYRELYAENISGKEEVSAERTVITEAIDLMAEQKVVAQEASLVVIHGVELGKKYDIQEETLIGRAENAHIRINEENVSRLHTIIFKKKDEIIIEDQNSTNGTFVNTRKVKSKALVDGDLILIGNTILKFMSGSAVEHQYQEEIYRLATLDGLTRAFNKNFFLERLSDEFGRCKRYDRSLSIIFFDIDHFKVVNDTHGHLAGDEVLRAASALIAKNLRKEDVMGRYGGEEFGIILPETSQAPAIQLAEKLRKLVELTPFDYEGKQIQITISLGVAVLNKNLLNINQFIDLADKALYIAKKAGRNCVMA